LKALHEMNDVLCGNVINIGGDHSMAIGTVSSTLNNYDDAKVVCSKHGYYRIKFDRFL